MNNFGPELVITMQSRRDYLRNLMAIGGVGVLDTMAKPAAAAENTFAHFVNRENSRLVVDGEPFYFSGTNNFWLIHVDESVETVDELFSLASQFGINTVRTWGFGAYFQYEPGGFWEEAFERLDYIIAKAAEHSIRLIIPFVDNWSHYGGMEKFVEWSSTASTHDDFYTDDTTRRIYKDYVEYVLERTNTYTGVAYKNDPTIMIWELANEPRVESDISGDVLMEWIDEMANFVKGIDKNHLLSTGMEGFYDGQNGSDYLRHHQSPSIDVCSFHLYPDHWGLSESEALDWVETHVRDAHEKIGKPAYLGEFGWMADRDDLTQIQKRNQVYSDWYDGLDDINADGALAWTLVTSNCENGGDFDIYQSDEGTTSLMADYATRVEAKFGTNVTVHSSEATDIGPTSATLNGEITDIGAGDAADVHFEWREVGASSWNATNVQTIPEPSSVSNSVTNLSFATDYEFRVVAVADTGNSDTSLNTEFTTNNGADGSSPEINSFTVSEAGSPNPHAELTVGWTVSDADGNLGAVTVEVYDSKSSLVDSATTNVSGSNARDKNRFKFKHGGGEIYDVTLVVCDSDGTRTTSTKPIKS